MIACSVLTAPDLARKRHRRLRRHAHKPSIHSIQSLVVGLNKKACRIPARYVYGSVELPAEQVMNWVGGAKTVDAAQQIMSQGGIPSAALVSGGKITHIRLEHTWVEALIQYQPGRGAKHIPGQSPTL